MRRALVIGRKHGEKGFTTLIQPTDPRSANTAFKALLQEPGDIAEMQLWESDAITKRKSFAAPPFAPASEIPPSSQIPPSGSESDPEVEGDEDGPSLLPSKSKKK